MHIYIIYILRIYYLSLSLYIYIYIEIRQYQTTLSFMNYILEYHKFYYAFIIQVTLTITWNLGIQQ